MVIDELVNKALLFIHTSVMIEPLSFLHVMPCLSWDCQEVIFSRRHLPSSINSVLTRLYCVPKSLSFSLSLSLSLPLSPQGMDLYSSSLWHLQKDVELSLVAESLHSSNKLSPQALCAMASVMNLNRNHESARKYLTRAIQVSLSVSVCASECVCVCVKHAVFATCSH